MKTHNGKKVVLLCKCGKVKPFDEWLTPSDNSKRKIEAQRQGCYIKFIGSVCDTCLVAKR